MSKPANTDHDIHDVLSARWSPYGFSDRAVDKAVLSSLFEAARWAASSFNEQPWRFLVATRDEPEEFARMLSCLTDGNQEWAKHVPVLILTVASTKFERNDKPNGSAWHDVGLASASLAFEATARGLSLHWMGGIHRERIRSEYRLPEGFEPVTAIAIGYAEKIEAVPEPFRKRDRSPRTRRPIEEFVFSGAFGKPAAITGG
ncbi:MAG: nitroreductase family protein [Gemmatimonadetes bacterium]|nr:nitroreductase family protein [Gemmatimonadota bacterium]